MNTLTKNEVIDTFIADYKGVLLKIEQNTALTADYHTLQEYIQLAGLPGEIITDELGKNGFDGWSEFYDERQKKPEDRNRMAIHSVLGSINGIGKQIIEDLLSQKGPE